MLSDELPEGGDPADRGMIVAYFMVPHTPQMIPSDEITMPMAVPLFGLPVPQLGTYYFSVRIDGREMDRAAFRVTTQASQQVPGEDPTPPGQSGPPL
jgi:hypothetical protein